MLSSKKKLTKQEIEFLPAAIEIIESPPSPTGRALLWCICLLLLTMVIWSIVGKVDEISSAPGKIIPTGYDKVVQAEDKGTINKIFVKEGQLVKKNQLLLTLDSTISKAEISEIFKQMGYLRIQIDRLNAEKNNTTYSPCTYIGVSKEDLEFQRQLYYSRLAEYQSKVCIAKKNIQQNQVEIEQVLESLAKTKILYKIALQKEKQIEDLLKQDAVGSFMLLDYRSRRIELEAKVIGLTQEANRLKIALQQSKENLYSITAQRNREIADQLVENLRQLQTLREELKKAQEKQRFSLIVAPVSGRINGMTFHTVGAVVSPAQALMTIVPNHGFVEVEALVANKDIGFIKCGQTGAIKVETFNFQRYGTLSAQVINISPDAIEDKDKRLSYKVNLRIKQNYIIVNGKPIYLAPGMEVVAEIKTKEKRIIEYFLDTFKRYQSEALRER